MKSWLGLVLGMGCAAGSACTSEVVTGTGSSTSNATQTTTTSSMGDGGAGGTTVTTPQTAIGGCYDTFECGLPLYGGCLDCETEACPAEEQACLASPRCVEVAGCIDGCNGDPPCVDGCIMTLPGGFMLYQALVACTACKDSCLSFSCPAEVYPSVACDI
jgi:hypothetical protein